MNVYEKLLAIQTELKAPKSQYNSFGRYNYRNCEDILEAVKPIAAKYNAVVTLPDEIVVIGERYYVMATAKLTDVETGDQIKNTAYAREEEEKKGMDGSQVTGASSSYARKYALNGLFAIDDTKDSDATNTGDDKKDSGNKGASGSQKQAQKPAVKQQQLPQAVDNAETTGKPEKKAVSKAGKLTRTELVTEWKLNNAEEWIAWLEKKIGYVYDDWTEEEHDTAREFLRSTLEKRKTEADKIRKEAQQAKVETPF